MHSHRAVFNSTWLSANWVKVVHASISVIMSSMIACYCFKVASGEFYIAPSTSEDISSISNTLCPFVNFLGFATTQGASCKGHDSVCSSSRHQDLQLPNMKPDLALCDQKVAFQEGRETAASHTTSVAGVGGPLLSFDIKVYTPITGQSPKKARLGSGGCRVC